MKKLVSFFLLTIGMNAPVVQAQQTTVQWDYDGTERRYIQYVPSVYNGSSSVPLVIALHGLGDNIDNFQGVGFQYVADTANFIVVYPEALEYVDPILGSFGNAWNSGAGTFGIYPNSDVDDVGFLSALMDTLSAEFNIDQDRIYVTGFSMGGFMSNRLACQLTDRVAAVASVAGTIGSGYSCAPSRAIPMCHFHGTDDTNVGYGTADGGTQNNSFGMNVSEWIDFWNMNNGCGELTLEGRFPDSADDGFTVDYLEYGGCMDNARVVHYKVNGADHIWLGPANDIFYTTEIWKFFLGLSPNDLVPSGIAEQQPEKIGVYPNPASDLLHIRLDGMRVDRLMVFNATGVMVRDIGTINNETMDVSTLSTGIYHVVVQTDKGLFTNTFLKQ